ncbi:MAG TPA: DUF2071 domain-containing protein, partial [Thermoanaerobaculia bacterium]
MTASEALTRQTWKNFVALHWPVPGDALRPLLPPSLTPALLDGHCRVTLAAFEIAAIEVATPLPLPKLPPFAQIEVRTYAQDASGAVGVWYLALATSSAAAATAARMAFGLDYRSAAIAIACDDAEEPLVTVDARADRPDPVACSLALRGAATSSIPQPESLDAVLLMPTHAWSRSGESLVRIDVDRGPTRVSRASVEALDETWLWSVGIRRPSTAAIAHFIRESEIAIHR